jgi:molybdopterin molybdotransferase
VSFHVFVEPAVRALQNLTEERLAPRRSRLAAPATSPAGRRSFLRGILDPQAGTVTPLTGQGSHQIASMARANVLIVVPEDVTRLPAGADVDVLDIP